MIEMEASNNTDLFSRIKECVSRKQEERGREHPVSSEEIASELGCQEEDVIQTVTGRIKDATFNGTDLLIRFNG